MSIAFAISLKYFISAILGIFVIFANAKVKNEQVMYSLTKVISAYVILHAAVALEFINLYGGMNTTWMQLAPHNKCEIPHNNKRLPIYDIRVDKDNHKLALLRWHNVMENHPSGSNLTIRTHNYSGKIDTKVCSVDSPDKDDNNWIFAEKVMFLKKNRVLITWKADHKTEGLRISSQVIFIDSCKSSDFININTKIEAKHNFVRVFHTVLKFKDFFDIVFRNEEICPKDYCKLSFNYNGEPLSNSVSEFSNSFVQKNETLYINSLYTMESNSGIEIVLTGNKNGIFYSPTSGLLISHDVYSPILGWIKADDLYYDHHVYSNSSGFASICWIQMVEKKLYCKWLDGTHTNNDGSEKILILEIDEGNNAPWICNSRDGQIVIIKPQFESKNKLLLVDKVNINGKSKRIMEIACEHWPIHVQLSITEQNKYCFSFIMKHVESNDTIIEDQYAQIFNFITKCISIPDEHVE